MYQDINGNQFESYKDAVQYYGGDWDQDDEDDYQEVVGDHAVFLYYAHCPLRARCY